MKVTLDSIRAEIEAKYEPLELEIAGETFVLPQLLRLPKDTRKAIEDKLNALDRPEGDERPAADEDETVAAVQDVLRLATNDNRGYELVSKLGDDLLTLSTVLQKWQVTGQVGEA